MIQDGHRHTEIGVGFCRFLECENFYVGFYEQKKPIGDVKYQFQTKFIQNIVFETERPNSRQLVKTVPPWAVYYSQNKIKESNLV